ncbi:MAG: hypothetical protein WA323_02750 [Candidatus Nitrosopolaris sp.]
MLKIVTGDNHEGQFKRCDACLKEYIKQQKIFRFRKGQRLVGGYSRDSFVKQPPDSISSSIVNSQTRYNSNGKINAVPILVYHNITNTIMDYIIPSHASSTTLDLFAQEMKYLHDNGFRVLLLNQVGYDSHSRNLYGT